MKRHTPFTIYVSDSSDEDVDHYKEEIDRHKEKIACKVCLDMVADVIFLPCAHIVSCGQCAPALQKCPLCRKVVHGIIKAFFAVDTPTNISDV